MIRFLQPKFHLQYMSTLPEELRENTVYVVGENGFQWYCAMSCPCGCGATIHLNLRDDGDVCWRLRSEWSGATLSPSVRRIVGCRSHFFLTNSRILWCQEYAHDDAKSHIRG